MIDHKIYSQIKVHNYDNIRSNESLFFADDTLLFCKTEPRECEEVMKIGRKYGKTSGHCINFDKSFLLFGKKINATVKQKIKYALGIQNEGGMETYLGIP